jgi:hypothetical protein
MACGGYAERLAAFIEEVRSVDVASMPGDELAGACLAVTRCVDALLAHAAHLTSELQQRGGWDDEGATSAATWVANRSGARRADIAGWAKVGNMLRLLPAVRDAVGRGDISFDHARRISDCARRHPLLAARDEHVLLDQARRLDADTFRVVARHWNSLANDTCDADPGDGPARHDSLHLTVLPDGRYRLEGDLSPDNGALVAAALDEHLHRALQAQRDGDPALERLPITALRAEGLVDLAAEHQRRQPSNRSIPDRYRVAIVLRPEDLQASPLACCDSDLFRAVMNAAGEVLDIGRATREWTTAIRRAVRLRDRGCVFPGCDRPPSWCDTHHCFEWDHGGPTSADNGAQLCRRHHTFIHTKRWKVIIPKPRGKPVVLKPDGTPHTIQRVHPTSAVPA